MPWPWKFKPECASQAIRHTSSVAQDKINSESFFRRLKKVLWKLIERRWKSLVQHNHCSVPLETENSNAMSAISIQPGFTAHLTKNSVETKHEIKIKAMFEG